MTEAPTKRLTDEQAELAGEHWDKAMQLARMYAGKRPSFGLDWESAAAVALCEAALRFEPEQGNKFWTFASHRIKFAFIDLMRAERAKGYGRNWDFDDAPAVLSLDCVLPYESGDPTRKRSLTWHDVTPSDDLPTGWEERSVDFVYGTTERLSKAPREILRLYYCHGLTLKQAGERVGVGESRASQIHAAALEFLRESIHPESIAC